MADLLRMPSAVAGETDAVLTAWLVAEGSAVSAQDPVATVETAKAAFDVPAGADGVLLRRLVPEGAAVAAGMPIAVTGTTGETGGDADALLGRLGLSGAGAEDAGAEDGAPAEARAAIADAARESGADRNGNGRIFISPIARRLAREAGLTYQGITGTGPNGRIVRRDVEAAIARQTAPSPSTTPEVAAPATPAGARTGGAEAPAGPAYIDIPHSRLRRAIAARLTESKQTIPHFYLRATPDVRKLAKLARQLNAAGAPRITLTHLLLKAAAHAHLEVPAMNVMWTPDAVRSFATVDLSVAIATDDGLVAPVVRSVEQLSVSRIAAVVTDLAGRARDGRLRPGELAGGTATITNLGMHGTEEFAAVINQPQSAILAVGAVREVPVVRGGKVRPGRVMTLTLSVDHRPVDGVTAARWLRVFTTLLEDPVRILR
ncbi:MAG TPA: dihydrolipoamide acetyltransferase family protein [Streptosporangiaceae bacterium]